MSRLPSTGNARRLATIMHRRLSTPWMPKEIKAFRALGQLDESDLSNLERYYRKNWPPGKNGNILRRDLYTLLNWYQSEVDRANQWNESHPEKPLPRKIIPLPPTGKTPELTDEDRHSGERFMEQYRQRKKKA